MGKVWRDESFVWFTDRVGYLLQRPDSLLRIALTTTEEG